MAEGLNKAMLIGNLGRDPELRSTPNGRSRLLLSLATTEVYFDQNKQKQEVTHWHNVVLWGPRAEALHKLLTKGSRLYIEGRIETRSYDDKDGVKKYVTEINAKEVLLLDGRRGDGGGGGQPGGGGFGSRGGGGGGGGGGARAPSRDAGDFPPEDIGGGGGGSDDDIPF